MMKIRAEANDIETKKAIEQIDETRGWLQKKNGSVQRVSSACGFVHLASCI